MSVLHLAREDGEDIGEGRTGSTFASSQQPSTAEQGVCYGCPFGTGVAPGEHKAVTRIGITLRGRNTFRLVRDTRSHHIGPVRRDASTAVFYKLLGGGGRP